MDQGIKKFNEGEMVVGGILIGSTDLACFIIDFIPGVGWLISLVIQFFVNFIMIQVWFRSHDVDNKSPLKQFFKWFGGELPSGNFWVFVVTVLAHNHPKAVKIGAQVAGAAIGGAAGAKIGAAVGEYATGSTLRESVQAGVTSGGTLPKNP